MLTQFSLASDTPFVAELIAGGAKRAGESKGFLAFDGAVAGPVPGKSAATKFVVSNGQLRTVGGAYVGASAADLATGYAALKLTATVPEYSTTFVATIGGSISFSNSAFTLSGTAEFCLAADGTIYAQYGALTPFDCLAITFVATTRKSFHVLADTKY